VLIAWTNRADRAVLTASSELAEQPGANVQRPIVAEKWGTAAGVKSAALTLDLGASLPCSVLALLGSNLTSAATVRLRGSDTDPTAAAGDAYDSGSLSAGVKAGYGAVYKGFTSAAARYWRVDLADASLSDNLEVGRLFLGPSWAPTYGQSWGWSVELDEQTKVAYSRGGQAYPSELPQARVISFNLDFGTEAEMYGNAFAMARQNGLARDVLAIHDIAGAYLSEQAVFGLLTAHTPLVQEKHQIFRQKFTIKERL